jgi:hypothetical protein
MGFNLPGNFDHKRPVSKPGKHTCKHCKRDFNTPKNSQRGDKVIQRCPHCHGVLKITRKVV